MPAPEGRFEIVGKILGMKTQDSDYGPIEKMLVQVVAGPVTENEGKAWKTWGTVPQGLFDAASVERKARYDAANEKYEQEVTHLAAKLQATEGRQPTTAEMDALARQHPDNANVSLRGAKVAFVARVKRSDKDEDFSFFSRPTSARVIDWNDKEED
jgi:hypothetical protein